MEAALVGILGAILGFATSFILEGRKRKWEREDRQREMRRRELEELSNKYVEMTGIFRDAYSDPDAELPEKKDEAKKLYAELTLIRVPTYDEKLEKLHLDYIEATYQLSSKKYESKAEKQIAKSILSSINEIVWDLQDHINELIDDTYK